MRAGLIAVLACACLCGSVRGEPATNSSWQVVMETRTRAEPLLAEGKYRAAASIYNQTRMRSRDAEVKEYLRFAADLCQLRDAVAKGRPGVSLLHHDFDDGVIPDSFRDGRDRLLLERVVTFGGSPGALTITRPTDDKYIVAESYTEFDCTPNTVLVVCVYGFDIDGAKFQLNTNKGSFHYFHKGKTKAETWTPMFFRLALDGDKPMQLGTRVLGVIFVAQARSGASFAVLDEMQVITHP